MTQKLIIGLFAYVICCPIVAQPINLAAAKQAIIEYYEEGQYEQDLERIADEVCQRFSAPATHDKQVVIFDVDETALAIYPFYKESDFGWTPEVHLACRNTHTYPAISAVLRVYEHMRAHGYIIIFLTARRLNAYEVTRQNLIAVGYRDWHRLITRPSEQISASSAEFKQSIRQQLASEGYEIVCCIDDAQENLQGEYVGFAVKIPNYLY